MDFEAIDIHDTVDYSYCRNYLNMCDFIKQFDTKERIHDSQIYQIDYEKYAIVCKDYEVWKSLYYRMYCKNLPQPGGMKIIGPEPWMDIPNIQVLFQSSNLYIRQYVIGNNIDWMLYIIKNLLPAYKPDEIKQELNLVFGSHLVPGQYVDVETFRRYDSTSVFDIWNFSKDVQLYMRCDSYVDLFVLLDTCIKTFGPDFPVNPMFFRYMCGSIINCTYMYNYSYTKLGNGMRILLADRLHTNFTYDWWENLRISVSEVRDLFDTFLTKYDRSYGLRKPRIERAF